MPDQPSPIPVELRWARPIPSAYAAYAHLIPSTQPALGALTSACGVRSDIWGPILSSNRVCEACIRVTDDPQLPQAVPQPPALASDGLPEGVDAAVADFGPFVALNAVPEGGTPLYGIAIVSVLNADGSQSDELAIRGTVTTRDAIGSIETAKFRLLMQAFGLDDE